MTGRLSIDFGTSNTVVALWNAERQDADSLALGTLSTVEMHAGREMRIVPSQIKYVAPDRVLAGQQVIEAGIPRSDRHLFYWMKTYIGARRPLPRHIHGSRIDYYQAGGDFLRQVLLAAGAYTNLAEEDVVFTAPVEAFEHYCAWLDDVVARGGAAYPRYIDEASAAALGYSARVKPGEAFLVCDFGGGTLDASVVRVDETSKSTGRHCRQLGKAGAQVGGATIDQWIASDVLSLAGHEPGSVRDLMSAILIEAERVKRALSTGDREQFSVCGPAGAVLACEYSRSRLEDMLDRNGLFAKLGRVLDLAEAQARERGYDRDNIQACLVTGGSSLIPSVHRQLAMRYGDRLRCERPFDAVAAGAAAYAAGVSFDDRVRHSYALRPYDRATGQYVMHTIVPAGTAYPCQVMKPGDPSAPLTITIKASNPDQVRLGLQVYEVATKDSVGCGDGGLDLVFDQNGSARYVAREDVEETTHRPIGSSTFISADPPARVGDPRFLATFSIDEKKRLCVTVQDKSTGKTLMRDQPMVKLT